MISLSKKDWLQLLVNDAGRYGSESRAILSVSVALFSVSVSFIILLYTQTNTLADSALNFLSKNATNATNYPPGYITAFSDILIWRINSLFVFTVGLAVTIVSAVVIMLFSSSIGNKKKDIENLYLDVINDKFKGTDKKISEEIFKRYYNIVRKKHFFKREKRAKIEIKIPMSIFEKQEKKIEKIITQTNDDLKKIDNSIDIRNNFHKNS
jgi:hypothetical protein